MQEVVRSEALKGGLLTTKLRLPWRRLGREWGWTKAPACCGLYRQDVCYFLTC